jgi:hypothetical protein
MIPKVAQVDGYHFKVIPKWKLKNVMSSIKGHSLCFCVTETSQDNNISYVCWVVTVKMKSSAAKPKYVCFNAVWSELGVHKSQAPGHTGN